MKSFSLFCALALSSIVSMHESLAQSPNVAFYTQLKVNDHVIQAEVAKSKAQRRRGLMFRQSFLGGDGMLFAYSKPKRVCMWMKNTLIPLSVAFVDVQGAIINIEKMVPHSRDVHCSRTPVHYALEMNRGWFSKRGIGPGSQIDGLFGGQ